MKIQLPIITSFSLVLLASCPVYAVHGKVNDLTRDKLNSVHIINNTNDDVVYRMLSSSAANMYYGVEHRGSSKYHAKPGDSHTTFEIGTCERFNHLTGICVKFDLKELKNCVNNVYYNANKIDSIIINSVSFCTVKCNDGTSTSCVAD
ncbi:MAG: hypothetical protein K2X50_03465 [Gammaproteobacteria bacterium]|nr:hypothetical protein [Gammaproteobacteria bacterium]